MPQVKRLPTHAYLENLGLAYEPLAFPTEIDKGAASVAQALGYTETQMVKTLLFETGEGERVMVLVGGDQKAISGLLKKAIGSRNIRMASPQAILETTGYEIGSIPPFGWQPEGFRSFLEASLLAYDVLGVGAGEWGQEIMLAPADLLKASGAQVVNLTERSKPVFPAGG